MSGKFEPDADLIRKLAELLDETGLGEIEYAAGDRRIRVARGGKAVQAAVVAAPVAAAPAAAPAPTVPAAPPAGLVTSPMVGMVYLAPEPSAPHFVKEGDKVREGQTLLIIEAMKVMNAIRSPRAGTVTKILVANGTPVEYGEPLLVVD
jgi:acetyl-CoA carboxylase biotin carboxyl carrier protein